jgi:glucose-1-phosphate thymidylyltransferase
MKATLLCAGFGTRLYPLTHDTAKPLLEVSGKPIVEYLVDQLAETTYIDAISIVSNARCVGDFENWAQRVSSRYPEISFNILNDGVHDDAHRLGSVGDLAFAISREGSSGPLLVSAGDNLFQFPIKTFIDDYLTQPRNLVLAYKEKELAKLKRTGVAEIDSKCRIRRLWEKPEVPPSEWACPAFYLLTESAVASLSSYLDGENNPDAIGHFISWLVERQPVYAHEMKGRRLDIGNLDNYRTAESWLMESED